jgi:Lon protease-like protein
VTRGTISCVPVFPLPGVVLFPRIVLPLHIFEPRYRAMLTEVLDGHGTIAMAFAEPRAHLDDEGTWEISTVVGLGKVATYKKNDDGTSDVILLGERRAEVDEWLDGKPFRTAKVAFLSDRKPRSHVLRDRLKAELERHLATILSTHGSREELERLTPVFARDRDVGFLADFLAYRFLRDGRERQRILEELDVEKRIELLRDLLSMRGML